MTRPATTLSVTGMVEIVLVSDGLRVVLYVWWVCLYCCIGGRHGVKGIKMSGHVYCTVSFLLTADNTVHWNDFWIIKMI